MLNRNVVIFIIITIGFIPLYIAEGGFFTTCDASTQILPFILETKRMLASGAPLWSWDTYFGQDFFYSYAYYTTTNPFVWLICLLPYEYIPIGYVLTIYLKLLLCGYLADRCFRTIGYGKGASMIGSLLYTFSSYCVCAVYYHIFLDSLYLFPLLIICIEGMIRQRRYSMSILAIVVFLAVWINYYSAVGLLIAAAIYYLCRVAGSGDARRRWLALTAKGFVSVAVGVLLAAVLLIPVYYLLGNTNRLHATLNFSLYSLPERILALFMPKLTEGVTPFVFIDSLPNCNGTFVPLFGLLAGVLYFTKKRDWRSWMLLIFVVAYLTPLNGIFNLLTDLNYTRWAYALVFATVLCTLSYLERYGMPTRKAAMIYGAIILIPIMALSAITIWWHLKSGTPYHQKYLLICTLGTLMLNLILLYVCCPHKASTHISKTKIVGSLAAAGAAQIFCFSLWAVDIVKYPYEITPYSMAYKCEKEGSSKMTHRSFYIKYGYVYGNEPMIWGCPGVTTFHSVKPKSLNAYTKHVDQRPMGYMSFHPTFDRESFLALMSVKYLLDIPADDSRRPMPLEKQQYKYYIPMGFAYDKYQIADSAVQAKIDNPYFDLPLSLLSSIAIKKEDESALSPYLTLDKEQQKLPIDSVVNKRRQVVCDRFEGDSRGFSAHISLDRPKVVFFSVITHPGLRATINGKETDIYEANLGLSAIIAPAGDNYIRFEYFPLGLKTGAAISLISLLLLAGIIVYESRTSHLMAQRSHNQSSTQHQNE